MGLAGEIGWSHMQEWEGNSTYRNRIIDAIYQMNEAILDEGAKYEMSIKILTKDLLLYAVTDRHWLNGRTLYSVVKRKSGGRRNLCTVKRKNNWMRQVHFLEEAKELQLLCREYQRTVYYE